MAVGGRSVQAIHSIDPSLEIDLPHGWQLLRGGADARPSIGDVRAFTEMADDSIVVTIATRDYHEDVGHLLTEVAGDDRPAATIVRLPRPGDKPWLRGVAQCLCERPDGWFVATLVVAPSPERDRARIAVEIVADGPAPALVHRLATLQSLVASVRPRRIA